MSLAYFYFFFGNGVTQILASLSLEHATDYELVKRKSHYITFMVFIYFIYLKRIFK